MSSQKTVIAAIAGVLVLLIVVFVFRGKPPEPDRVAEEPPPADTRPSRLSPAEAPDLGGGSSPTTVVQRDPDAPLPTAVPAADPMAEFRREPFTGLVVEGKTITPIPGARVVAYLFEEGRYEVGPGYPPVLEETVSDVEGKFEFTPREVAATDVLGWRATAPGFNSILLLYKGGQGQGDKLRTTFLMAPAGEISGTVVDQEGKPVAGASVGSMIMGNFRDPGSPGEWSVPSSYTTSDAGGLFRLEGLELEKSFAIPAKAETYLPHLSPEIEVGRTDVVLVLTSSDASLSGKVVQWDGKPARNAIVTLRYTGMQPPGGLGFPVTREERTTSTGSFQFPALASGPYALSAELKVPETLGPGCIAHAEFAILSGEAKTLELTLPAPARISGRFVEGATDKGIEGVTLFSHIDEVVARSMAYQLKSDDDGAFEFTAFVPAEDRGYEVRLPVAWGKGWFPMPMSEQEDMVRTEFEYLSFMAVKAGEERTDVTVFLQKGGELTGVVMEPDDTTPAREVPIFLRGSGFFANMTTDEQGAFTIGVPAGIKLRFESSSELGIGMMDIATKELNETVRLVLQEYGSVSGLVVTDQGEAVGGVQVAIKRAGGTGAFEMAVRFQEDTVSDDDGVWSLTQVAPGSMSLVAQLSSGTGFAPPKPVELSLTPAEERTDVKLVLEAGDFIEGRVVDAMTGRPIPEVTIFTSMSEVAGSTDAQGKFKLVGIPYDTALESVTASVENYAEQTRRNVSIYDGELLFELVPRKDVTLRVVDAAGAPVQNFRLKLLVYRDDMPGIGGQVYRDLVVNDPDGSTKLEKLADGDYRAEVVELLPGNKEGGSGAEDFRFEARNPLETVEVRLTTDLQIVGVVLDGGTDSPVAGAQVSLLNPPAGLMRGATGPGNQPYKVVADSSGQFAIGPIPGGRYILSARQGQLASREISMTLASDSDPVVLELEPAPRVFGTIKSADGRPVRGANIFVLSEDNIPQGDPHNVGADYSVLLPHAGKWMMVFSENDTPNTTTRTVNVAPGESFQLDVDFSNRVTLTGVLTVNGKPATMGAAVMVRSTTGEQVLLVPEGSDGRYEAEVSPGTYEPWYSGTQVSAPAGDTFTIAADPPRQRRDFAMSLGAIDVLAVSASGNFEPGLLSIDMQRPGTGTNTVLNNWRLDRTSVRFLQLPVGLYRGTLYRGGESVGMSGWVEVRPEQPAMLVLEVP